MTAQSSLAMACAAFLFGCRSSTYMISGPAQEPPVRESRIFVFRGWGQDTTVHGNASCPTGVAAIRETRGTFAVMLSVLTAGIASPRTLDLWCRGGELDPKELGNPTFVSVSEQPLPPGIGQQTADASMFFFNRPFASRYEDLQPVDVARRATADQDQRYYRIVWSDFVGTAPIGGADVDLAALCGSTARVAAFGTVDLDYWVGEQRVYVLCDLGYDGLEEDGLEP